MNKFKRTEMFPFGSDINEDPNKVKEFRTQLLEWAFAAMSDGWVSRPMSPKNTELRKGQFVAHVSLRDECQSIALWANGGLHAITDIPVIYDMADICEQTLICHFCHEKSKSSLKRVGFANVACSRCYSSAKAKIEVPGWCD